ncbi:MAG: hypothetical protein DI543_15405, partial [Bradyrhizobium icense]
MVEADQRLTLDWFAEIDTASSLAAAESADDAAQSPRSIRPTPRVERPLAERAEVSAAREATRSTPHPSLPPHAAAIEPVSVGVSGKETHESTARPRPVEQQQLLPVETVPAHPMEPGRAPVMATSWLEPRPADAVTAPQHPIADAEPAPARGVATTAASPATQPAFAAPPIAVNTDLHPQQVTALPVLEPLEPRSLEAAAVPAEPSEPKPLHYEGPAVPPESQARVEVRERVVVRETIRERVQESAKPGLPRTAEEASAIGSLRPAASSRRAAELLLR